MNLLSKHLTVRVLFALVLGIAFGLLFPKVGCSLKILADVFIRLIKLVIVPIVFLTIAIGIGTMKSIKKLGRISGKAFIYFEIVTTFSLALGILVVHLVGPGHGFPISYAQKVDISNYTSAVSHETFSGFITNLFPDNALAALAKGDMLPILVFAVLFGLALAHLGEKTEKITELLQQLNQTFFRIVGLIMALSPIAVFGAMAYTVGQFGWHSLLPLAKLAACGYLTMMLFVVIILGAIAYVFGFNIFKILYYIRSEIAIVIGTSSSETVLPNIMAKLEAAGCSKSAVGLVVPTGYSFNLDGTAIYLAMSVTFIAQAYHITLTPIQMLSILGVMMLTSKGAAAVPGSGFITLAATLGSLPHQPIPIQGIALVLGIDRFMSEARSVTNLIGNTVATLIISKSESEFLPQGIVERNKK